MTRSHCPMCLTPRFCLTSKLFHATFATLASCDSEGNSSLLPPSHCSFQFKHTIFNCQKIILYSWLQRIRGKWADLAAPPDMRRSWDSSVSHSYLLDIIISECFHQVTLCLLWMMPMHV